MSALLFAPSENLPARGMRASRACPSAFVNNYVKHRNSSFTELSLPNQTLLRFSEPSSFGDDVNLVTTDGHHAAIKPGGKASGFGVY